MANISSRINDTTKVFAAVMTLALFGLVLLIVFGNLSGNLGFAAGSQGETDTNAVITNVTSGAVSFFSFSGTWFTLLAVTLLIIIALSIVAVVRGTGNKGGFSS